MLFNSPQYIFIFLPIVVIIYFYSIRHRLLILGKSWLVLASLYFYGYWNYEYLFLILSSLLVNFAVGVTLQRAVSLDQGERSNKINRRKIILAAGIAFNLGLLGCFKYTDFFILNINTLLDTSLPVFNLVLPLAISFFTFQQIAYLVDCYSYDTQEYDFLNYCLFVTFFPQLIAGPIVHHKEMMPQFFSLRTKILNYSNISKGIIIFCIGLFKKIIIADTFAFWANQGFNSEHQLLFIESWTTSLSYTLQLYYDFSGYTDMAIGSALLFNIMLPINFDSPYKSKNIKEFWRRWHITLSNWLRDYLYIPLGGNRVAPGRVMFNLLFTFFLGGLWHGAGWTFIIWGLLHGFALMANYAWNRAGLKMNNFFGWLCTFLYVNFAWVFFRASDIPSALGVITGMLGGNGFEKVNLFTMPVIATFEDLQKVYDNVELVLFLLIFSLIAFFGKNSLEILRNIKSAKPSHAILCGFVLFCALIKSLSNAPSDFLYFNF